MWAEVNTLKAERDTLKGIVDSLKQPLEEHTAAADELWKKRGDKRKELVGAPSCSYCSCQCADCVSLDYQSVACTDQAFGTS